MILNSLLKSMQPMKFKPLYNPTQLTCQITIGDWQPCEGVQKLIGFTRGLAFHKVDYFPYFHHSNSIRLGYNRVSMQHSIRLWLYSYVDGKRVQVPMGLVNPKEDINVSMFLGDNAVIGYWNDDFTHVKKASINAIKTLPIGVLLRPYAEIDGKENKRTPFEVDIKDLKVNGKLIKI